MNSLIVAINDTIVYEYSRPKRLPGIQRRFLDQMDEDMNQGITLENQEIESPDQIQRNQYVVMHLIDALEENSSRLTEAMCAYLTTRCPDLAKIDVVTDNAEYQYSLKFDNPQTT
jgi:hypothetical protein